jgi:hypothetical protein
MHFNRTLVFSHGQSWPKVTYPNIPVSTFETGGNKAVSRRNGWLVFTVYSANRKCSSDAAISSDILRFSCCSSGLLYAAIDSTSQDDVPTSLQRMAVGEVVERSFSNIRLRVRPFPAPGLQCIIKSSSTEPLQSFDITNSKYFTKYL